MTPHILILETSGRVGQVALALGEAVLAVRRLDEARRHARDLAPAIAELLKEQGWQPRDVHCVIASKGPGSYTGLRVGIMAAKAFAYATGCSILGVETFAAIALQVPKDTLQADVITDAQQSRVYVQSFERGVPGEAWTARSALTIKPLSTWLTELTDASLVTGPGLRAYRDRLPHGVTVTGDPCWDPKPESLLQLGLARFQAGQRDDLWTLEPLYLRPSAAEEQWQAKS